MKLSPDLKALMVVTKAEMHLLMFIGVLLFIGLLVGMTAFKSTICAVLFIGGVTVFILYALWKMCGMIAEDWAESKRWDNERKS